MSSFMHKVKEAFHSDKDKDKSSPQKEGSHGPHDSRTSNTDERDPRVESDRGYRDPHGSSGQSEPYTTTGDNYAYGGADQRQAGGRGGTGGDYGRTQPRGAGTGHQTSEYPEGTYGGGTHPANYDPAYDSSRRQPGETGFGAGRQGAGTYGTETGAYGTQGTTDAYGTEGTTGAYGTQGTTGAHGTHGTTGAYGTEGTTGAYGSGAQGTDPYGTSEGAYETHGARGDEGHHAGRHSGSTGAAGTGGTHPYASTGPAPNTAGPHKSDMMNKLDPRVDSDLDGSKTYMGNKTFSK